MNGNGVPTSFNLVHVQYKVRFSFIHGLTLCDIFFPWLFLTFNIHELTLEFCTGKQKIYNFVFVPYYKHTV
jgi:hypothetical protein